MNIPCELTTFKGSEGTWKFFYLYENVVTKSLLDSERAEMIVAYLSDAAFDFLLWSLHSGQRSHWRSQGLRSSKEGNAIEVLDPEDRVRDTEGRAYLSIRRKRYSYRPIKGGQGLKSSESRR